MLKCHARARKLRRFSPLPHTNFVLGMIITDNFSAVSTNFTNKNREGNKNIVVVPVEKLSVKYNTFRTCFKFS